jgi:hypothetical protein
MIFLPTLSFVIERPRETSKGVTIYLGGCAHVKSEAFLIPRSREWLLLRLSQNITLALADSRAIILT